MKTIEDLNKLVKEYGLFFSFKEHWQHWPRTDRKIQEFVYNNKKRTLYAMFTNDKMEFVCWEKQWCIEKAFEEINIHKSIWCHCLYADPL